MLPLFEQKWANIFAFDARIFIQYYVLQVDSNMKLGEWAGLCKIDQEGKARKVGTNVANL